LRPSERALGNAVNQAGVSLGAILAPPLAAWFAVTHGWRGAFVVTGALGLLWIPLWNWAAHRAGPAPVVKPPTSIGLRLLGDGRLWAFALANALSMVGYSLWSNWTTQYLVDEHRLSLSQSAWYAWIPPVFALLGGFSGGWLSRRLIDGGLAPIPARFQVCLLAAAVSLATLAIPAAPTPAWASAGISLSIFAVAAFSVNMYSLPLDAFGGSRAAFAVSLLVASYGAVQFVISPIFGRFADLHNWAALTTAAALTPLAACAVLWGTRSVR
jgi:ACS family hexuronate transporter-like MFS transporter